MSYVYLALGWLSSNILAVVVGGYLVYRFPEAVDKVEEWVDYIVGLVKRA